MPGVARSLPDHIPRDRQQLALEGFFGIMIHWGVDNASARRILGMPAERTYYEWKKGKVGRLPQDTLRRIGYVAGIWKALEIVYSDPALADGWVKRPNDTAHAFRRADAAGADGGGRCDGCGGRSGLC